MAKKLTKAEIRKLAQESLGVPVVPVENPQKVYHFRMEHQVDRLVAAGLAQPDAGFLVRLLALCTLPRTNPGRRRSYERRNGPYHLAMSAVGEAGRLPYGTLPRLLLAWVCTEAVRTQRPTLVLGRSLSEFMRKLGITSTSGGTRGEQTRLRNQMERLFSAVVTLTYEENGVQARVASVVATRTLYWWNPKRPGESVFWNSEIELAEPFFREVVNNPLPINMNILKALKRSSLGLDLYMWLTYRTFGLKQPLRLHWSQLYCQFGADPARAKEWRVVGNFRAKALRELKKIKVAWSGFDYALPRGYLVVFPVPPAVPAAERTVGRPGGCPRTLY